MPRGKENPMLAMTEKTELRAMMLRIVDVFQAEGHWPTFEAPRRFLCGHAQNPARPDLGPAWTTSEHRPGWEEDNPFKRGGIPVKAVLTFVTSPPELDSRPLVYIHYWDDTEEVFMVDAMKWLDDPKKWESLD
jgi:hypothetical protein